MKTCCFIGHRNANKTPTLCAKLRDTVERLIREENVRTFLFGGIKGFDSIACEVVNDLKKEHSEIKLVNVRLRYVHIPDCYLELILQDYDETVLPSRLENAGKASYVERNQTMINDSDFCVFYYNENYLPPKRKAYKNAFSSYQPKSGTRIAYEYSKQKEKTIINLYP